MVKRSSGETAEGPLLQETLVPEHLLPPTLGKVSQSTQAWGFFNFYFKSSDSFNIQVVAKSGHV